MKSIERRVRALEKRCAWLTAVAVVIVAVGVYFLIMTSFGRRLQFGNPHDGLVSIDRTGIELRGDGDDGVNICRMSYRGLSAILAPRGGEPALIGSSVGSSVIFLRAGSSATTEAHRLVLSSNELWFENAADEPVARLTLGPQGVTIDLFDEDGQRKFRLRR